MKKPSFILSAALVLGMLPSMVGAQGTDTLPPGQLIKGKSSSAVYYVDADLNRYVFANPRVFFSWYGDFDDVVEVDDSDISSFPIGGNVPYKAGKRLVKLQTDPKVYAVDEGGVLRWVKNERVAKALYGDNWNAFVDDLSDAFFANYTVGEDIEDDEDFDARKHAFIKSITETLLKERAKRTGDDSHGGWGNKKVALCKGFDDHFHTIYVAQPAVQAHVAKGATLGECDGDTDNNPNDTTAPTISNVVINGITSSGATVNFHANEVVTGKVFWSTTSPVNLSTASHKMSTTTDDDHAIALTGLTPNTTYYVVIKAMDASNNWAVASETSFTTAAADTTAPVVSNVTVSGITNVGATVNFHASENVTATVYYSTASPINIATAGSKAVTVADDDHAIALTGLHPTTTYYAVIVAKDASNNSVTSSETSFVTLATDVTAPVVSGIVINGITNAGSMVNFHTSENTTATVYYSTASPVNIATAASKVVTVADDDHVVALTGLTQTTTYYVVIVAKDAALNATTISETPFVTLIAL